MKQVVFKDIEIQNFLSVGDEPVRIDFRPGFHIITGINRDKQDRRNGIGKCVDPSTEIDIVIDDLTVLEKYKKFIESQ